MGVMESTSYLDLSGLKQLVQPPEDAVEHKLTLVYERGDGSVVRYDTNMQQAWAYEGDPYSTLGGAFETYDDIGDAYFTKR